MKIRPVEAEFLHSEGRTDATKLIVAFRNFANAPKNNLLLKPLQYFCKIVDLLIDCVFQLWIFPSSVTEVLDFAGISILLISLKSPAYNSNN